MRPIFETDKDRTYFLTVLPSNPLFVDLSLDDYKRSILEFCTEPKNRKKIMDHIKLTNKYENAQRHLQPLIDAGYINYLYPHIPKSPKQEYITTNRGISRLGDKKG